MMLYIHIPYCDSKCSYCSFNSYTGNFNTRHSYMAALLKQFASEKERFGLKEHEIESVFIGGGTPSALPHSMYAELIDSISPFMHADCEFTTEANPNSTDIEWLNGMKRMGVNRISFGIQSFDDQKLKMLGRSHSSADAVKTLENAFSAGYDNVSFDLIYDCMGDEKAKLMRDIDIAFSFPISHISAYELTIESGTKFATMPDTKLHSETLGRFVSDSIRERGFEHYEISNYGIKRCMHNLGYWEHKEYVGIGAGAVGFVENRRLYTKSGLHDYIDNPCALSEERVETEELLTEKIFLGMRSCAGIKKADLTGQMRKNAEILRKEGRLFENRDRFYNNDFFVADEITLFIMQHGI